MLTVFDIRLLALIVDRFYQKNTLKVEDQSAVLTVLYKLQSMTREGM